MNPPVRAPLGAALALLLALGTLAGPAAHGILGALVLLLVVLVAAGWPDLLKLPSAAGTRGVVAGTGVLGTLMALFSPGRIGSLEGVAMVCAVGIFAAFGQQMVRRDRADLTASLTGTVAGVMLAGMATCWIPAAAAAADSPQAAGIVAAGALGLAAALLVLPLPAAEGVRAIAATVLSVLVVGVIVGVLGSAPLLAGLLLGALIGVGTSAAHLLLGETLVAREPLPTLTVAAAPVATAGVVVLIAARLLG